MEPAVVYPTRTIVELDIAQGFQTINAVIERRERLVEEARRLVRLGLDSTQMYRTINVLDEAEELLRDAFGITKDPPEWLESELREAWGR